MRGISSIAKEVTPCCRVAVDLLALLQRREKAHQHGVAVHQGELVDTVGVAERGADLHDDIRVAVNRLCIDDDLGAGLRQRLVGHLGAGAGAAFHQHLDAEGRKFLDGIRRSGDSGLARDDLLRNPDPHARIDSAFSGAAPQCPAAMRFAKGRFRLVTGRGGTTRQSRPVNGHQAASGTPQSSSAAACRRVNLSGVEIRDQVLVEPVPIELRLQMEEDRAEADGRAVDQHELARRGDAAQAPDLPVRLGRDRAAVAGVPGFVDHPGAVVVQGAVDVVGPDVERFDHLVGEIAETPGLVGVHREVAVVVPHRAVEVDDALHEAAVEHADAAIVEEVDRAVLAHGVVAEMRIAVEHAIAVERHVPGVEHVARNVVAPFGRGLLEVEQRRAVEPVHGQQPPGREGGLDRRHVDTPGSPLSISP